MQSFGMNGLGDGYGSALYEPAQNDLGRGSVKNFSHFLKMQKARQSVKVFVLT